MSGVEAIFGVVTGGAGLLSLGVELGQSAAKLRRLYHAVKDAPKTIVLLVFDLETMAMALSELEKTRQRDSSTRTILERCIMRCRQSTAEVKQLVDKMERCIAKHSRLRGKLYTAFKERDVKELLDDLERAKSTLEFAYTMYHSEEQMERHDKHHNMLSLQSRRSDDILQQLMLLSQSFMPREQRQLAIADEEAAETCPMPVIAREMGITVARTDNARHDQTRHCQPPRRRVKSEHTKNQRRIRFRLPVWLCSKIWDLTINSSHCGWSMHLSTYRAVSKYSAIFLCCFKGDIEGVQRLIQNGEASLLDTAVWDFDGQELHTLIELSTHFGQRALCQYLLQQTPWPDQAKVLSRALSCYRGPREEPDEHMYRLFFDTPGFDADFEGDDREHWLSRCTNWECLEFVLRSQFPHFFTLSADEKFALVIHKGMRDIETPTDFAKLIGLSRSDQRLATLRCSNGTTVLHYVAKRLRDIVFGRVLAWPEPSERPYRISKRESLQDWLSFGASLLKDGADPCSIAYPECTDRGNAPASPLLEMLGLWNFKWQFKPSHEARTRIMVLIERIRIWAEMLQQAGIDLYQYGASESEIWQSLKPFYLPSNPGPKAEGFAETMIVEQLVYGSTPADWGVLLCPFWTIHVYKLRRLPGDFVGERLLPEVIPWSPMREEDGEGYWDIVKSTTMTSTSTDLRNLAYPSIPNFVQLLHGTQDDHGVIVGLQYRASRAQHCPASARRRSRSQPPLLQRREAAYCGRSFRHFRRPWLDSIHFCLFDSQWTFGCAGRGPYHDEYGYSVFEDRNCGNGTLGRCSAVQETDAWTSFSFLNDIRQCQQYDSGSPDAHILGHTGTTSCPRNCSKVDLDQLNVPESLRRYHPWLSYWYDEDGEMWDWDNAHGIILLARLTTPRSPNCAVCFNSIPTSEQPPICSPP